MHRALVFIIACCVSQIYGEELVIEKQVYSWSPIGHISSPGFPECCQKEREGLVINITVIHDPADPRSSRFSKGLFLIFTDFDIPIYSVFQLYDGENLIPNVPVYNENNKTWSRHIYHSKEGHIRIVFHPGSVDPGHHTGFRFEYQADLVSYFLSANTACGSWKKTVEGGSVEIPGFPRKDCLFVIQPPTPNMGVAFMHSTYENSKITVMAHLGNLSIGTNVTGVRFGNRIYYISNVGPLYVRIQVQTFLGGPLTTVFSYFSMEVLNDIKAVGSKCSILSTLDAGIICNWMNASLQWCVPSKHRCNKRITCPYGEDEKDCATTTTAMATTMTTTRKSRCASLWLSKFCANLNKCVDIGVNCETGCRHSYVKCDDGSCEMFRSNCPNRKSCEYGHKCIDGSCRYNCCAGSLKECDDRSCVPYGTLCPGESCSYSEITCRSGTECYSSYEKCNGVETCSDGSDEEDCPKKLTWWQIFLIVAALLVGIILLCYCCQKARSTTEGREDSTNLRVMTSTTSRQDSEIRLAQEQDQRRNQRAARDRAQEEERSRQRQRLLSPSAPTGAAGAATGPDPSAPPPSYVDAIHNPSYRPSNQGLPSYDTASREILPQSEPAPAVNT